MLSDLIAGLDTMARQFWRVLTVPPANRSSSSFYKNKYWEADEEHQAMVPPDSLRRDWRGRTD